MKFKEKKKRNKHIINILILFTFFIALAFMYVTLMNYLDEIEAKNENEELQAIYYQQPEESTTTIPSETPVVSAVVESSTPTPASSQTPPSQVATATATPTPTVTATPTPIATPTPTPTPRASFAELLDINKDVVGWLKVDGTTIDYPVLLGDDNDYYMKHSIYGNETLSASIFMDYRNNVDSLSKNTIIYGHNMGNGYMFSNLEFYVDYKTRDEFVSDNGIISFDSIYENMKFEIFSAYIEEVEGFQYLKTTFSNDAEYMSYINSINKLSYIDTGVTVGPDDKIITLSTCNHWFLDSRTVIHARLISD